MRSAMKMIGPVSLVLFFASVSSARWVGQEMRGIVKVTTNGGIQAIVRVQLKLLSVVVAETLTRDGRFEFPDLPAGHYTLVADAPGYEPMSQEVDVPGQW